MNSGTSRRKRAKKILHVRYHKRCSTNKSHSHIGVTDYKKQNSSLLKKNKKLVNALSNSHQELLDVKNRLEISSENWHKMMCFQNKLLLMHSSLKTFMTDFDEALQLIKHDSVWPTLGHITRSRKDFQNKMQSVINPIEETSEGDSISVEPEISKFSVGAVTSSDIFTSNSVASVSSGVPENVWTEPQQETRVNQTSVNETAFSENVFKSQILSDSSCQESSGTVTPNEKKDSNRILPTSLREISKTPEFPPCIPSVSTDGIQKEIYLSPKKLKNSKIPRFKDLSANMKKTHLFDIPGEEKSNNTMETEITVHELNSDFHQKTPLAENSEIPSKNTVLFHNFDNKHSNHEVRLTATNSKVSDVVDFHHKETLVTKKMNKKSEDVINFGKSRSNRSEISMKKICISDRKIISTRNKRETFIVMKDDEAVKSINNSENCNMIDNPFAPKSTIENVTQSQKICNADKIISSGNRRETFVVIQDDGAVKSVNNSENYNNVNTFAANDITENIAQSLSNNTEISSSSHVAQVLNPAMSRNTEYNNNLESTELLADRNKIFYSSCFQESEVIDKGMVNVPVISNINDPPAVCSEENKEFGSCFQRTESCNVLVIPSQGSQEKDQCGIHVPEISCNNDVLVMHTEVRESDSPSNNVNVISDKNTCLELEINDKNNENKTNILKPVTTNLNAASNTDNLINENEEIDTDNDITVLKTSKLKGKSSGLRMQRISYHNFFSSSDSENEVICDTHLDFLKDVPLVKDPPIRKRISKSKPKKVFVFDANKRKSSFFRNRLKKLQPVDNSLKFHEGNIPNQPNDSIVDDSEKQNIQDDIVSVKEVQLCKKVRLSLDTSVDGNNTFNMESKTCENKSSNSSKIPELSNFASNEEHKIKDIESNDNVTADKIEAKVYPSSDVVASANCQKNMLSNDVNRSVCDQNECIINHNHAKNTVCETAGEVHCFEMQNKNESKPKKLKRMRQKPPNDQIQLDDFVSTKKSKRTKSKKVDNIANSEEIIAVAENENQNFDCKHSKKGTKSKEKKIKKKVKYNQGTSCKNTIVVHAEIHPPPPFVNLSSDDSSSKENKEVKEMKCRELSVILNDVFQTDIVNKVNMSCDKALLLSKGKPHLPSKTPLLDNSSNVQSTVVPKDATNTASNSHCFEEIRTDRRRRGQKISYKEPSLSMKMRR